MRLHALLFGSLLAVSSPALAHDVVVVLGDGSTTTEALVRALAERGFIDESGTIAAQRLPAAEADAPPEIGDRLAEIREQFYDADFGDASDGALELIALWEADPATFANDPAVANEALEVVLMGVRAFETRDDTEEAAELLQRLAGRAPFAMPDPSRVSDTQSLQLQSAQAHLARRPLELRITINSCAVFIDGFLVESALTLPTRETTLAVVCDGLPRLSEVVGAGDSAVVRWVVPESEPLADLAPPLAAQLGADRLVLVAATTDGAELAAVGLGEGAAVIAAGSEEAWVSAQLDPPPVVELPMDVETPRHANAAAWTFGALALGAAGAGAWLESRVVDGRDAVAACADRDACVLDGSIVDERRDLRLARAGATAAWASAGALAAGALVAALVDSREGRVALVPTFGPTWVGVSVTSHLRGR